MKTTTTFSVVLFLQPNKRNRTEGLIYASITVNGIATELSLKETIPVEHWNPIRQEAEGRTPQVKALNAYLDDVAFKLKKKYRQIVDKDLPVNAQVIKDALVGKQTEQKGHTLCELVTYHYKM